MTDSFTSVEMEIEPAAPTNDEMTDTSMPAATTATSSVNSLLMEATVEAVDYDQEMEDQISTRIDMRLAVDSSSMSQQRLPVDSTSTMCMQVNVDEEKEKTTASSTMITTGIPILGHERHSISHRLDQTTLRLCGQLLLSKEIISFGRTCHALYAALNHPLTWKYSYEKPIDPFLHLPSASPTPFLRCFPCIWRIRAADVTSSLLMDAIARLPQQPYRLIGLQVDAAKDDTKNATTSALIQSLLKDVRMTNHLSLIYINPSISVSDAVDFHFMPRALLKSILQLPQVRSIWIQVESLTNEIVTQLTHMYQLEYLGIWSLLPSKSSILPILASSTLRNSLTKLALPSVAYLDEVAGFDCLAEFHQLHTLEVLGRKELMNITIPLSRIHSLRHLSLIIEPRHPEPTTLMDLVRNINTTMKQFDTLTLYIEIPDPLTRFLTPVSSDHPLFVRIQDYLRHRHAAGFRHRRSGRLIVRALPVRHF